jgi:hypothetical protein
VDKAYGCFESMVEYTANAAEKKVLGLPSVNAHEFRSLEHPIRLFGQ